MVNVQDVNFESKISRAFDAGFANAARSLSQITKLEVTYSGFHSEICQITDRYLVHDTYQLYNEGSRVLLTTEIFGDLTGKSYLLLSAHDKELLTHSIPGTSSSVNLKEEFLKELDNIISAAVITKISNELNKKMFGDIPVLVGETKSHLEDMVNDDFLEQSEELFISAAYFSFEKQPDVRPLFLWVLDGSKIEVGLAKT